MAQALRNQQRGETQLHEHTGMTVANIMHPDLFHSDFFTGPCHDMIYDVPTLEIAASRRAKMTELYQVKSNYREDITAKLIPYFAFANRGISDMQIWTQVK